MVSKKDALLNAGSEGIVEGIKMIPGLNILVSSLKAYQDSIEEQQRTEFITQLNMRLEQIELISFNREWYKSSEGIEVSKKIIASALNAEYADKIEYFANALINSSKDYSQDERLKYIEILRIVSKPALKVLAKERELHKKRGERSSPQVSFNQLVKNLDLSPHLIETCINELYSLGVFSHTLEFSSDGHATRHFDQGTSAYTKYSEKFVLFLLDPRTINSN
jgi:hypothetical protein